ncbi:hypothetical protein [Agrobacterium tumefaciens]|uniref:hypothetical protein n=1 Tax=Agrobacterium tumefaciens TaxID=358 RepID=UPI00285F9662|nr:hypothetical protein [Agrobacterium tumefaciens]MDR6591391.1 hypothetical protein [Agrobacterium tumefaciens]
MSRINASLAKQLARKGAKRRRETRLAARWAVLLCKTTGTAGRFYVDRLMKTKFPFKISDLSHFLIFLILLC